MGMLSHFVISFFTFSIFPLEKPFSIEQNQELWASPKNTLLSMSSDKNEESDLPKMLHVCLDLQEYDFSIS